MSATVYDFAIIGAGAAGLQLALAMQEDVFFKDKKILIIDKDNKDQNDRTWCFWEKGAGKWDSLLRKSWSLGDFHCFGDSLKLELQPYAYKMLRGLDFYNYAKKQLANTPQFTWKKENATDVKNNGILQISTENAIYSAKKVFDSRIPADFLHPEKSLNPQKCTRLLQHFKGWIIRTPEDKFDPTRFNMMDYRLLWKDKTSFTYVLPLNAREAMVEFTLFSDALLGNEEYDLMLHRYMHEILKIDDFEIVEVEQGLIPMSDFNFQKYSTNNHILIGTAGGWVKPSSGYTFKNCERNVQKVINNLKSGQKNINHGLFSKMAQVMDSIFLDVLMRHNDIGPSIFHSMYMKNDVKVILAFLDEKTTFLQNIKIAYGFPKWLFTKSAFHWMLR
jgi:lycopene beta-cyclase